MTISPFEKCLSDGGVDMIIALINSVEPLFIMTVYWCKGVPMITFECRGIGIFMGCDGGCDSCQLSKNIYMVVVL